MNYSNVIGFLLSLIFLLQFVSGILLSCYYSSFAGFSSVYYIMIEVNVGWLIRFVHVLGASIFMFFILCHWIRGTWIRLKLIEQIEYSLFYLYLFTYSFSYSYCYSMLCYSLLCSMLCGSYLRSLCYVLFYFFSTYSFWLFYAMLCYAMFFLFSVETRYLAQYAKHISLISYVLCFFMFYVALCCVMFNSLLHGQSYVHCSASSWSVIIYSFSLLSFWFVMLCYIVLFCYDLFSFSLWWVLYMLCYALLCSSVLFLVFSLVRIILSFLCTWIRIVLFCSINNIKSNYIINTLCSLFLTSVSFTLRCALLIYSFYYALLFFVILYCVILYAMLCYSLLCYAVDFTLRFILSFVYIKLSYLFSFWMVVFNTSNFNLRSIEFSWIFSGFFVRNTVFNTLSFNWIWISGLLIWFFSLAISFLGYCLCWGQMSYWGITVMINIFTILPLFGSYIGSYLWCSSLVILNKLFMFHFFIGFIIGFLILVHIYLLHLFSSFNLVSNNYSYLLVFYAMFFKDCFVSYVVFSSMSLLLFCEPDAFGSCDNLVFANPMSTPNHIVPEWYFLLFYALLRSFPNKTVGVIIVLSFIILIISF